MQTCYFQDQSCEEDAEPTCILCGLHEEVACDIENCPIMKSEKKLIKIETVIEELKEQMKQLNDKLKVVEE